MAKLTPEGEMIVAGLAEQYKIGAGAVKAMLDAVAKGGGATAQFNVPEFGGSGQWMRGGPATVGDMVNTSMKATVENLCTELSNLMAAQASLFAPMSQPPSHGEDAGGAGKDGASVSPKPSTYGWWPRELGEPSTAGSRDSFRYAYFAGIRRLAVDFGGRVEVYDTTGFNIEGIAPRQGSGDALPVFASNRGPVRLDSLPREYGMEGEPKAAQAQKPAAAGADAILALIEQLGALKEKGILTDEEFAAKKAELLKRL